VREGEWGERGGREARGGGRCSIPASTLLFSPKNTETYKENKVLYSSKGFKKIFPLNGPRRKFFKSFFYGVSSSVSVGFYILF
jgi:hypothetical protein